MSFMRSVKRRTKASIPPLIYLTLVGYFCWNAVNGDRGLKATAMRREELKTAQMDLSRAESDQAAWERRVSGLQTGHLDPDTLDERARAMLNMASPGDIVVPYPKDKRLF